MSDRRRDRAVDWLNKPMSRREAAALLVVLALVVVPVAYAASHPASYTTGATIAASGSGPQIAFGNDINLSSGNWAESTSKLVIQSDDGDMNVTSSARTYCQIRAVDGTWTNVSTCDVDNGDAMVLDPATKPAYHIENGVTRLNFKNIGPSKVGDGTVDFQYRVARDKTGYISVPNLTAGTQYGVVDTTTQQSLDVAIADSSGRTNFSDMPEGTYDIEVVELGTLEIRNVSDPGSLVTESATVTFYPVEDADGEIVTRTTSTGQVDMAGLPVDERFIVVVNATNYTQRSIVIDDLNQQQDVFLVPSSVATLETYFVIEDPTGNYPPDSSFIKIQRALNRSTFSSGTGVHWTTVSGDYVEPEHLDYLVPYERYRVIVQNTDGDQVILASYDAEVARTLSLTIGSATFDLNDTKAAVSYGAEYDADAEVVRFSFNDEDDDTTNIQVAIYEKGNRTNEIYNTTHLGPYGKLQVAAPVNDNQTSWVVEWSAEKDGVGSIGSTFNVGEQISVPITEDIPEDWLNMIAVGIIVLVAAISTGGTNRYGGLVVTVMVAGGLWLIGWLAIEAGVLLLMLFMSMAYFATKGNPGGGF